MWLEIYVLTMFFEFISILGRLWFGSARVFHKKNKLLPFRIHHGYVGLLLVCVDLIYSFDLLFILGMSLFISDALHHFVVLKLWVKRTEFP
jgi:hypothetical protein